jgi:hypothetical protein
MSYITSWTDALAFHHDLPFIPLHYTYVTFPHYFDNVGAGAVLPV